MKLIKTVDAVGHIICHDMTQIIKDSYKDVRFRKGHVVQEQDIPVLLAMGKERLFIFEKQQGFMHEDAAALVLKELCKGEGMRASGVKEGKIELFAATDGLFISKLDRINRVNSLGEIAIAARRSGTPVFKDDKLVGTRVIPLMISEMKLKMASELSGGEPLFNVLPFKLKKAAIITTGSEILKGLIVDAFAPVVQEKINSYGIEVVYSELCGDEIDCIVAAIDRAKKQGAQLIICTGGMSVDPDDATPGAIARSGAEIVTYGAPVLPGAMLMLGYFENGIPIVGLPGCVMYNKITVFDKVLPKIAAGVRLNIKDITAYANGGLCLDCPTCHFPNCTLA